MSLHPIYSVAVVVAWTLSGGMLHADDAALAKAAVEILDDNVPRERREALIAEHAGASAALLRRMTKDLTTGTPEETRRIPWIWRVTIAAGKRNEPQELLPLFDASLPERDGRLFEWQAVVLGGGLINGISLAGDWPAARIEALLKDRPDLRQRWKTALQRSATMADDERIKDGTRYDALRIVALDDWNRARPLLERYLASDNAELQQGAVSGLADVPNAEATKLLLDAVGRLTGRNRDFALDALLRSRERRSALLDAIEAGRVDGSILGKERRRRLLELVEPSDRERALRLLPE